MRRKYILYNKKYKNCQKNYKILYIDKILLYNYKYDKK